MKIEIHEYHLLQRDWAPTFQMSLPRFEGAVFFCPFPTRGHLLKFLTHLWGEVRRGGKSQQGITSGTPAPEASMRDYLVRILFVVLKGYGNV